MENKTESGRAADSAKWTLHPQLAQDCAEICDLPLSRLLVSRDANYPWLLLVPRRPDVGEIIDLSSADQAQLTVEIAQVGAVLKEITACDKLNVAAIGNVVPQLHVHVVARRRTDAAWPRPVWGTVPPTPYAAAELAAFIADVRRAMRL
jgi:diadenosine tetraphosphate (Ap4A) HIT family hydrolase